MSALFTRLAIVVCLGVGCSSGSGADMGGASDGGGGEMGQGGGGDDLGQIGGPGLSLLAGQAGGIGTADRVGNDARFRLATSVAPDGAGNLYVADAQNGIIRKLVTASGAVTTFRSASNSVWAVVTDNAGNLFYTDSNNNTITQVVIATNSSSVLVGSAAMFNQPSGMASDGAGNLYVADYYNSTLRKVVVASGAVTTFAGGTTGAADGVGAAAMFTLPNDVAYDGGNLYIADSGNCAIRQIVIATATVTTLAGTLRTCGTSDGVGPAARFMKPVGVTADGAGKLYVADHDARTIRQIVIATGAVTTLAGAAGMNGISDGVGSAARFGNMYGIKYDGAGNLFVPELLTIRKIVAATGAVTTVAGLPARPGSADGTGAAASFSAPHGLTSDGAGNLYIADYMNCTIRKLVLPTGVVTTLAGTAGGCGTTDGVGSAARFALPTDVAADHSGNVYVADNQSHKIRKIVVQSGTVTTLAGSGSMGSADGVGSAASFNNPQGVAWDPSGKLYVADTYNYTIRQIDLASGAVTTLAGSAGMLGNADGVGSAARFHIPQGVLADGTGKLYVADTFNYAVRQIDLAMAKVTTLNTTMILDAPHTLAYDGAGNLYLGNSYTVAKIVLATGATSIAVGSTAQYKQGVALGPLPGGVNQVWGVAWIYNQGLAFNDLNENVVLFARGL